MGNWKRRGRFYEIWRGMRRRCYETTYNKYKDYGAQGIKTSAEWKESFDNFCEDMLESYNKHVKEYGETDTTLDRIDVFGNYCKENCRWATWKEQANNRRNNIKLTYKGETHTLAEWEPIIGIKGDTLEHRIKYGWSTEDILTKPLQHRDTIEFNGEEHTNAEWAKITGIPRGVIYDRVVKRQWDVRKALTTPCKELKNYFYNGESHNIVEWANISGINKSTLSSRLISKKWSIERALTTPVRGNK